MLCIFDLSKYHQSHQSHSNKSFTLEDILLIYTTKRMNYLIEEKVYQ